MNPSPDASADTPLTRVSGVSQTPIRDTPLLTPPADTPLNGASPALAALAEALAGAPPPCRADPDAFFDGDLRRAAHLCAHCHATAECLALARALGERHGVWGGVCFERRSKASA